MDRKEKGVEREEGKSQVGFMLKRLKGGFLVGKKAGPSTPAPTWRLEFTSLVQQQDNDDHSTENHIKEFLNFPTTTVSARKLCASLWEIEPHHYFPLPAENMNKLSTNPRHRPTRHHMYDDLAIDQLRLLDDPVHEPPDQLELATLWRKYDMPALQRSRPVERNGCSQQPLSPASSSSSMEVAAYNKHAKAQMGPLDFKHKMVETGYSLKTSKELLKVLNRIWSLEEQHTSNMELVKAMKVKLDYCRARIKKLQQEKGFDRQEMDVLIRQITDERIASKNTELGNNKAAVQSLKDELEDERKLRKRSESLQRKLARELSEVKSSLGVALRDLGKERKSVALLETLCDEFAKGVRDYDQEIRLLKKNHARSQVGEESLNRLILHIAEAWLDERMQMNAGETGNGLADRNPVIDKLAFDIGTFLEAKRSIDAKRESSFPIDSLHAAANERYSKGSMRQDADFAENLEGKASSSFTSFSTESGKLHLHHHVETRCDRDYSLVQSEITDNASPAVDSTSKATSNLRKTKSYLNLPMGVRENTLMAKLLEARLDRLQSNSKPSRLMES